MASSGIPETCFTDDYLDSLIKTFQENLKCESKAENVQQKCNNEDNIKEKREVMKNTHLEDSGNVAALEELAEPEGDKDSAEPEGDKDSAEPDVAEDSAETKDVEGLVDNGDVPTDFEKDVRGGAEESENWMKAPICLIENTANGKLVVNPEAIDILSRILQRVVVVAIVGLYRTGKSYLMNKLAGAKKGFNLGSTVQSETKGIWMWCVPHPTEKDHTLVLLDTEGLGDVEKGDSRNDAWLFSLALLLSSALVYNSKGTIDQDALDKLKFVGEISNLIKVKTGRKKQEDEDEFSTHFPIFVWTVRDFLLELIIGGKSVTADQYMENALRLKTAETNKELSQRDEEFNKVREQLRLYFGKRKCFTFDLPTSDKKLLRKLEQVSDNELCPEFVAQSKEFCDYVFRNAKEKRLDVTVTVTGQRLGELAKIYTDAICSSKIACMEDAVASLSDKENQRAVQEALQHYRNKMEEVKLPTETNDDFFNVTRQYEDEARMLFMEKSFRDENQKFLKEFMKNLHAIKNEFWARNEKASQEICEATIKKYSADFDNALIGGMYLKSGGHGKYIENLLAIEISYNKESGKGVKAEEVLKEYIKSKKPIELAIIQEDNAMSQREKEIAEENNRRQIEEKEKQMRKMEEEVRAQKHREELASLQKTIKDNEKKMKEEKAKMDKKLSDVKEEKLREQQSYLKQQQEEQARQFQNKIDELQRKINRKSSCTIS